MKTSGKQHEQICSALVDGFSKSELKALVHTEFDVPLETISDGANLTTTVYELVSWAERKGRIDDLISAAYRQNPGNPQIQQLVQDARTWRASSSGSVTGPATTSTTAVDVRKSDETRNTTSIVTVQHDDKPLPLQKIFKFLESWVQSAGLSPESTATNQTFTNSYRYSIRVSGTQRSLCAIQYMSQDNPTYVEFRFQGNTLQACGLQQELDSCWQTLKSLADRIDGIAPKYTDGSNEYKVRIYPSVLTDPTALEQITSTLGPVLRSAAKRLL